MAESNAIKSEYIKLSKKYKLPKFEKLDSEFELRKLDTEGILVKEIVNSIVQKLSNYLRAIDPPLDPNPGSLHSYIEYSFFGKEDKKELFAVYKTLAYLIHKGLYVELLDEKDQIEFINKVWSDWPDIKKSMQKTMKKISEDWLNYESKPFDKVAYLG